MPRDELAEVLWGDELPATWEKALRVLMTKLRAVLEECGIDGSSALTSAFGCYRLSLPEAWIDVDAAVEALERAEAELAVGDLVESRAQAGVAVALARRSFLPGEDGTWVQERRRDLREVHVRALECLRDAALQAGDATEAVRHAEEVTELEPYRESGYRALMQAHAAAGNPAEALRVYDRCRRFLSDELGAYPSPETQALYQEVLQDDRRAAAAPAAPDRALAPDTPAPDAPPRARHGSRRWLVLAAAATLLAAAIWVSLGRGDGADAGMPGDSVASFDEAGRTDAPIAVGAPPSHVAVADDGAVWVGSSSTGTVRRIDPKRGVVVQTTGTDGSVDGLAADAGSVWVASAQTSRLLRISPETNAIVQRIDVPNGPRGVALGERAVWVTGLYARTLTRVDPNSGRRVWSKRIGGSPSGVAAGAGAVWVTDEAGARVLRVDPRYGRIVQKIGVGNAPAAIAAGAGALWVANTLDGTVSRIDPATNAVVATIRVGEGPAAIAAAADRVWVASELAGTVATIDPDTNAVQARHETGQRPVGVALGGGRLWVAARDAAAAHRGGTLRFGDSDLDSTADQTDFSLSWQLNLSGDGLVAYRRAHGADGATLVPDLAVAIPTPTDGGRTYTFQVRRGIRYSSGETVGAVDFRRAIERFYRLGPVPVPYYDVIAGAAACRKRPATCDLSRGIVADPGANTVTFHLTRPDPNLLHALALPFAHAVAASAPREEVKGRGLPATGPYVLASRRPRELRFVRNPRFHEWSRSARPDGYPDEIVVTMPGGDDTATARAIEQDRLDLAYLGSSEAPLLQRLGLRYPSRLRADPVVGTYMVVLNTKRPPFGRRDARRAVAYALDRRALAGLGGQPQDAEVACQILPPNFSAHRRYCPYTRDPRSDGPWRAPDVFEARRLVARSGTAGAKVVVRTWEEFAAQARHVASMLRELGYRARVGSVSSREWFAAAYPSEGEASLQVGLSGWIVDYLAPSTFFDQLRCGASDPARFCSRAIDRQMDRALALQASDPDAADDLWARIDRLLTDEAAWIPYATPRRVAFTGDRVGNYQFHPVWHALLDQMWVR